MRGFDLIHYFFDGNGIKAIRYNKERGENDVIGVCTDGLCLGEVIPSENKISNFKTYISNYEMHENQKDIHVKGIRMMELENKACGLGLTSEELYRLLVEYCK